MRKVKLQKHWPLQSGSLLVGNQPPRRRRLPPSLRQRSQLPVQNPTRAMGMKRSVKRKAAFWVLAFYKEESEEEEEEEAQVSQGKAAKKVAAKPRSEETGARAPFKQPGRQSQPRSAPAKPPPKGNTSVAKAMGSKMQTFPKKK